MIPSNFQTFQSHSFATVGLSGLVLMVNLGVFTPSMVTFASETQTGVTFFLLRQEIYTRTGGGQNESLTIFLEA